MLPSKSYRIISDMKKMLSTAFHQKLRQGVLSIVLLAGVFLAAIGYAQGPEHPPASSSQSQQIGKVTCPPFLVHG
jgi:hypothetical protein